MKISAFLMITFSIITTGSPKAAAASNFVSVPGDIGAQGLDA